MGRSRIAWAGSVVAPWAIALGFLVSITAQADQDPSEAPGVSHFNSAFYGASGRVPGLISARYTVGSIDDLSEVPDEIDPKTDFKPQRSALPQINRHSQGRSLHCAASELRGARRTPN